MSYQARRDSMGVLRACNDNGVSFTYAAEHRAAFERRDGGTAEANLRTVSKGSSRGAGPQKKQGRVYGKGGNAEDLARCAHGQRAVQCAGCKAWHCACPGSPAHHCEVAP